MEVKIQLIKILSVTLSIVLAIAIHIFVKDDGLRTFLLYSAGGLGLGPNIPSWPKQAGTTLQITSIRPGRDK